MKMKKSFILFLGLCGVVGFLVAPAIAQAGCPDGADCPVMAYRSLDNPKSWTAALGVLNGYIIVLPATAEEIYQPTKATQPGYVGGAYNLPPGTPPPEQWTYVIDFPSPLGGNLWNVEDRTPGDCAALAGGCQGVSGALVFSDYFDHGGPNNTPIPLPSTSTWTDPTFLSEVEGVTVFVTGCSSVVTYEHDGLHVPEPGVLLLLGSGLIGLVRMRRVIKA